VAHFRIGITVLSLLFFCPNANAGTFVKGHPFWPSNDKIYAAYGIGVTEDGAKADALSGIPADQGFSTDPQKTGMSPIITCMSATSPSGVCDGHEYLFVAIISAVK
jgi:hypothetical protein